MNYIDKEEEEDSKTLNKREFEKKNSAKSIEKYKKGDWEYRLSRRQDAYDRKDKYRSW